MKFKRDRNNEKDVAVSVKNLSKDFRLPHESNNSIKGKLINFNKRGYEIQNVLRNISFDVRKGDFFGIVGCNGSGKSTLLKIISGIYTPTKGEIKINGKLTPFIELGVGFNPELSGRDNVFLNGALLGFSRKEMEKKYDDIVKFAELERFMDQKLKNYSSGMQVRLAFSIAIQADTDILVLDEVLAVGDEAFQQKCFQYFADLKKRKKTVILVTHDMSSVKKFCTKSMLIDKGKIVEFGSPEQVANKYTLRNIKKADNKDGRKEKNESWIQINAISSLVTDTKKPLECEIEYYTNIDDDISFGISLIDGASNHQTSVINDYLKDESGKRKVTSRKKGQYKFKYKLDLSDFNNRDFDITAVLYRYDKNKEDFAPIAFTEEDQIFRFSIRGEKHDSGLLKLKGEWSSEKE